MIPESFQLEGRNGWGQTLGKSCKIANSIEHYLHNVVNDVNLRIPAKVYKKLLITCRRYPLHWKTATSYDKHH